MYVLYVMPPVRLQPPHGLCSEPGESTLREVVLNVHSVRPLWRWDIHELGEGEIEFQQWCTFKVYKSLFPVIYEFIHWIQILKLFLSLMKHFSSTIVYSFYGFLKMTQRSRYQTVVFIMLFLT